MKRIARCPQCHSVFRVSRANTLSGKLTERLKERLGEIEAELLGLAFHRGIYAEQERALRRERFEIEKQLSGKAGGKVSD
jgi:hypothetical protein